MPENAQSRPRTPCPRSAARRARATGGGSIGAPELAELTAGQPPALVNLGGAGSEYVRLTIGFATAQIAAIRLSCEERTWTGPVGVDGSFLLGTAPAEPLTRAVAVGHDGAEIGGPPILL